MLVGYFLFILLYNQLEVKINAIGRKSKKLLLGKDQLSFNCRDVSHVYLDLLMAANRTNYYIRNLHLRGSDDLKCFLTMSTVKIKLSFPKLFTLKIEQFQLTRLNFKASIDFPSLRRLSIIGCHLNDLSLIYNVFSAKRSLRIILVKKCYGTIGFFLIEFHSKLLVGFLF
ncbi:hypothetical protein ACOME3_004232 [Neoechinorhynchus agilis]